MLQTSSALLTLMFILTCTESFSLNKTAELISTYAKVAHWGTPGSSQPINEGRSNGQTLWTHRSDVNIRRGQNLKPKQPVTYYYSMQVPSSKVDQSREEPIPSKGEVQERFNPRPYFDFTFDDPPRSNQRPDTVKSNVRQSGSSSNNPEPPAIVYGTPVDSFPGFDKPPPSESNSKPPSDAYNSLFSSYNPPDVKPDDSKSNGPGSLDFPPNDNQPPPASLYGAPNDIQPPVLSGLYGAPTDSKPSASPSGSYGAPSSAPPSSNSYDAPPPDVYDPLSDTYGPPKSMLKPPKESHDTDHVKPPHDYSFHPPLSVPPPDDSMPYKRPDNSYLGPPPPNGDDESDSYYAPPSHPPPANGNGGHSQPSHYAPPPPPPANGNGGHSHPSHYAPPPPPAENGNGDHLHPSHYAPPAPPAENGNGDHSNSPPGNFHGMGNGNDDHSDYGPPISPTVEPPGPVELPYFDHPPTDHGYEHHAPSMAESDLAPPPAAAPYGKIPEYLEHKPNDHDFYHFGHHDVYHEVHHTTTTTTEAPRAGPYSYYYLGRKLWYIPLYFSVYFIVYVTVLILKSIARHKIQFSHNFDKGRSSRELDINSVNRTVIDAIENVQNKYM